MKYFLSFIFLLSADIIAYGQNTDSQRYLREGNACFERGDYDCAKKNYEATRATGGNITEQLQKTEECIKILFAANLLFEGGEYLKACEQFRQILKLNPHDPLAKERTEFCERRTVNRFTNYTEIINNLNIEMIAVQGGTFIMGCTSSGCLYNERPDHRVTVSNFYIGKFEITQAQWMAVIGNNPSSFKGDNLPVENVSWEVAQEFIRKLNAQTGKQYRMPTEAEWEFAARGGNSRIGFYDSNTVDNVAWYRDNSGGSTNPVGSKAPNELGIYDMFGNVWEWCSDWFGTYVSNVQTDPRGPASGSFRVNRGGSWINYSSSMSVSCRGYDAPDTRNNYIGFRLACVAK